MAVVGGGPVGLLLGCLLAQRGVDVRVLERDAALALHSRAVGVHPPGLECLAEVGVADVLSARGVRVRRAIAHGSHGRLGQVDFDPLPDPYPYVLCVPQHETEQVLEQRLCALSEHALQRGAELITLQCASRELTLTLRGASNETRRLRARYVVGCDGKHSVVRKAARIRFEGAPYDQHFVMADTHDETAFGQHAAVFLTEQGLVESFPLPNSMRRWVVGLGDTAGDPSAAWLEALVEARTGQRASANTATMVSTFTAERLLAKSFVCGRITLAGDAAHVLSPIGGQGMNLGWFDARLLAHTLQHALATPGRDAALLARYGRARRRAARAAIRRAELYMGIGQCRRFAWLRDLGVRAVLSQPLRRHAAKLFTMHGLMSDLA